MIDFLKIKVTEPALIKSFEEHHLLYYHSSREHLLSDRETIINKHIRQYKGLQFEFDYNVLYIKIKPHYYFNSNHHNANDFSVTDCVDVLKEITNLFKVDWSKFEVVNIEFGINMILPYSLIDVKELLVNLIYHGKNEFYTDRKYPSCRFSNKTSLEGKSNTYKIIKCYAKGIQFPQHTDENTFRFEVKSNRKNYIRSLGIENINDLFNEETYNKLSLVLIKEFDELLIIDEVTQPNLSKRKLEGFRKKLNPLYWKKIIMFKSRNVFRRNFNQYYKELDTAETHLKKELKKILLNKLEQLRGAVLTIV